MNEIDNKTKMSLNNEQAFANLVNLHDPEFDKNQIKTPQLKLNKKYKVLKLTKFVHKIYGDGVRAELSNYIYFLPKNFAEKTIENFLHSRPRSLFRVKYTKYSPQF